MAHRIEKAAQVVGVSRIPYVHPGLRFLDAVAQRGRRQDASARRGPRPVRRGRGAGQQVAALPVNSFDSKKQTQPVLILTSSRVFSPSRVSLASRTSRRRPSRVWRLEWAGPGW